MFRFVRRFGQDPKFASRDLAEYLWLKLPSFKQFRLKAIFTKQTSRQMGTSSSVSSDSPNLTADISEIFHVPESFVRLYREQGHGPIDWSWTNWQDFFEHLPPLQKLSVPFAMSTVIRGRSMLALLEAQSFIRRKDRYLDVGTGYGGFLRAAKELGFREVIGIELQPDLVALAQANVDGLQGAQVLTDDFLKGDFSSFGRFDLITCNDVIEHVDNPELAIKKMSNLVNEGGCICFEVPNKDAINFVKSDGHFLIFGITQLSRQDAAQYHFACTGAETSYYLFEMGELYELDWYFQKLSENGLSTVIADTHSIGDVENVPDLLADLKQTYHEWQAATKPRLEQAIAEQVDSAVEKYLEKLERDSFDLGQGGSELQFKNRYLRAFWTIIATKEQSK